MIAYITNRSFIDSRTFDGFRKVLGEEFAEVWVVDLGGDVRANPKLSGTKNNVFGIQTGVAISFLVKKKAVKGCKIFYTRRPEFDTAEDKLAFVSKASLATLKFDRIEPDAKHNWLNLTDNDFDNGIPIASKAAKAAKSPSQEKAIFKHFTLGVSTNRDEWVLDFDNANLQQKVQSFLKAYLLQTGLRTDYENTIKWSETLKRKASNRVTETFDVTRILSESYRPFVSKFIYASALLIDRPGTMSRLLKQVPTICITGPGSSKSFHALSTKAPFGLDFLEKTYGFQQRVLQNDVSVSNITDWGLAQFVAHYGNGVNKEDIFHYAYAVLHNPAYREKYAQNLKRDFPRIPLYGKTIADFTRWAAWGKALMDLHIGFETVEPYALTRRESAMKGATDYLKPKLKADKDLGTIVLDDATTLTGIPPAAWNYKLGNRCALEWVLDQYKETKPKDPTIREKFDTYRFADYKEHVIDLLGRVCAVSVQTQAIVTEMKVSV